MIHFGWIVIISLVLFLLCICISIFFGFNLPEWFTNLSYLTFVVFIVCVIIWGVSYNFENVVDRKQIATYQIVNNDDSVITVAGRYSTPMVVYVDETNHFKKLTLTMKDVVFAEEDSSENYIDKYQEKIKFLCFYVTKEVYYIHLTN